MSRSPAFKLNHMIAMYQCESGHFYKILSGVVVYNCIIRYLLRAECANMQDPFTTGLFAIHAIQFIIAAKRTFYFS